MDHTTEVLLCETLETVNRRLEEIAALLSEIRNELAAIRRAV